MKVEIVGLDDTMARCTVSEQEYGPKVTFAVSSSMEAHQLLRLMIHNAARALADRRADEQMKAFAQNAHKGIPLP